MPALTSAKIKQLLYHNLFTYMRSVNASDRDRRFITIRTLLCFTLNRMNGA